VKHKFNTSIYIDEFQAYRLTHDVSVADFQLARFTDNFINAIKAISDLSMTF